MHRMVSSGDLSKDMRRRLRKRLKEDLIKIQGLSSKLEARVLQLTQSRSGPVHPSFSDAQFSGSDIPVRGAGGKEVTSQLNVASNGAVHVAQLTKQQSFAASNGSLVGAELLNNKRTPKVSQVYNKSEFLVGKEKLPSPAKLNSKLSKNNGQETRLLNEVNHKRKLPGMPNEFRLQCRNILKKLMGHEDGWIFNEPVDAVKLGLSDYHIVVKKPMDLGTIKNKLEKRQYASFLEFADDVKLTFNNAMTYNPPGNDVHQSAKMLLTMFQKDWETFKEKFERTNGDVEVDVLKNSSSHRPEAARASSGAGTLTNRSNSVPSKPKLPPGKPRAPMAKAKSPLKPETPGKPKDALSLEAENRSKAAAKPEGLAKPKSLGKPKASAKSDAPAKPKAPAKTVKSSEKPKSLEKSKVSTNAKANVPKKAMSYEEKVRLQTLLGQLPQHKLEELIYLMRERNINMSQEGDEIEVDLDSFDDDTLWELDRRANECLKNLQKGPDSRKRPREDNFTGKTGKKQKGLPQVSADKNATLGNRSSSESGSSTDSDSGSSSSSDSDG